SLEAVLGMRQAVELRLHPELFAVGDGFALIFRRMLLFVSSFSLCLPILRGSHEVDEAVWG
ncbi:MAG: hypothetical protein ACOVS5_17355, partial [Oligoflexus sp.]